VQKLIGCFESLGAKTKMDNPRELQQWMKAYTRSQGRLAGLPQDSTRSIE